MVQRNRWQMTGMLILLCMLSGCKHGDWRHGRLYIGDQLMKQNFTDEALVYYNIAYDRFMDREDSLKTWWRAVKGEAEILTMDYQNERAAELYEEVRRFGRQHSADSIIYIANHRLAILNYLLDKPEKAQTYMEEAQTMAERNGWEEDYLSCMKGFEPLIDAATQLSQQRHLTDSMRTALHTLTQSEDLEIRTEAAKLLTFDNIPDEYATELKKTFLIKDSLWLQRFHDGMMREDCNKAHMENEHAEYTLKQQIILSIVLLLFTIAISYITYRWINTKRKYERSQFNNKEKKWMNWFKTIKKTHFYKTEIGRRLPTPENPQQPQEEDYKNLFVDFDRQEMFIAEYDRYFENFASNTIANTPNLSTLEIVTFCLYRLKVRPSDIALMFSVSNSAISTRHKRIKNKIHRKI